MFLLQKVPNLQSFKVDRDFWHTLYKSWIKTILHYNTHNRFTALWNLSGKTRVSRYQNPSLQITWKHSASSSHNVL